MDDAIDPVFQDWENAGYYMTDLDKGDYWFTVRCLAVSTTMCESGRLLITRRSRPK